MHERLIDELTDFCRNNVYEFAFSDAKSVPFDEKVCAYCRENRCGLYNTRWTCPPAIGSIEENRKKLLTFTNVLLFSTSQPCLDFADTEAVQQSRKRHLQIEKQIRAFFVGHPYRLLSAGACNVCEKCTYPDAPCRFPLIANTACEAVGIHVLRFAEQLGLHISDEKNNLIWFSVIFFSEV